MILETIVQFIIMSTWQTIVGLYILTMFFAITAWLMQAFLKMREDGFTVINFVAHFFMMIMLTILLPFIPFIWMFNYLHKIIKDIE